MPSSIIIAQILGPLYVVFGIGLFLNGEAYREMLEDLLKSPPLIYMAGFLALSFGLLILAFHGSWAADWTAIITLFGWLGTLKGVLIIVRPGAIDALSRSMMGTATRPRATAVVPFAPGLFLSAKGFGLA